MRRKRIQTDLGPVALDLIELSICDCLPEHADSVDVFRLQELLRQIDDCNWNMRTSENARDWAKDESPEICRIYSRTLGDLVEVLSTFVIDHPKSSVQITSIRVFFDPVGEIIVLISALDNRIDFSFIAENSSIKSWINEIRDPLMLELGKRLQKPMSLNIIDAISEINFITQRNTSTGT